MSNYIHLDSTYRDRVTYPNPSEYQISYQQQQSWNAAPRTIHMINSQASIPSLNYSIMSIELKSVILPYSVFLLSQPVIYVDIHNTTTYPDMPNATYTLSNVNSDAKFVLHYKRTQSNAVPTPVWIEFESVKMDQVMRFGLNIPISVRIFTRDGNTLPNLDTPATADPDPNAQTLLTFEFTPYVRDGDFKNQFKMQS